MNDLTIEPMRQVHIDAIAEIENEVFANPWTAEMFRQEVADNQLSRSYVLLVEGRVTGYIVSWFLQEEVHLLNIAVAPSRLRGGLGRHMLSYLIDTARREHKEVISLEVRESNESAIAMYRSTGFVPVGLRRDYYRDDRENALLMALPLARRSEGG
jgi:ribosomal-protein-alanine N-acetyltransferase